MKKDFQKTGEKIEKLLPKLRQECLAFLSEELSKKGSICFDDDAPDDYDLIFINYDSIIKLGFGVILYTVIYCLSMYKFGMNVEEQRLINEPLRKMLKR